MICMLTKEGQRNYLQNGNAGQPGEEAPWAMGCTEAGGNAQTPERGVEWFIPHSLWASGQPPSLVILLSLFCSPPGLSAPVYSISSYLSDMYGLTGMMSGQWVKREKKYKDNLDQTLQTGDQQ